MKLIRKKIGIWLSLTFGILFHTSAQLGPVITSWVLNTDSATGYGGILSNVQIVQYHVSNIYKLHLHTRIQHRTLDRRPQYTG
jgi:hypothetical protein